MGLLTLIECINTAPKQGILLRWSDSRFCMSYHTVLKSIKAARSVPKRYRFQIRQTHRRLHWRKTCEIPWPSEAAEHNCIAVDGLQHYILSYRIPKYHMVCWICQFGESWYAWDKTCAALYIYTYIWYDIYIYIYMYIHIRKLIDIKHRQPLQQVLMMPLSNGNIFRVTGHLCGEFTGPRWIPAQRPVMRSFDVFFDQRLNKRLSKQSWGWWFETLSCPLWRHCNV